MSTLTKTYEPQQLESVVSKQWLSENAFAPKPAEEAYCIVIPPPNVTGSLHMGHAFTFTIQDSLIRWQRMQGKAVLWQPGTDHAGIATQMVVERLLDKEGKHRRDMGRDAFLERVWQWKESSGGTIVAQLKRLGASCDWSRERFTLDEGLSSAVKEVFVRLHDEGLIYRGKRLVNWDPVLETAVSDLEVEHEEEQGSLWHMAYPLVDQPNESLIVATTRPETMFGDAAVAVHPDDVRYTHLIGKKVLLPLCNREIPIIADTYVDPEFGTGCVKITPAHDFNDYDVGKRHNLPMINLLTPRAHLLDDAVIPEKYRGMERYEARQHVVADLQAAGFMVKIEPHTHQVGRGDRSHAVLEPYLTDQWYVSIKPLAEPALKAVEDGDIRFIPAFWDKTYYEWMRNIQDWCISRQLWWGHRIPAWYCADCAHITVAVDTPSCCAGCGSAAIRQDEDVLDTWFSSALWPFSTLGWPEKTAELEQFYPTQVLVTGFDIIFFWVARMIMMGLKFTDQIPFKDIYIHALIRDAEGQKMSKSKGNVIDPLDMIDLYGADALRFTLAHMATAGRDVKLDIKRIESNRNFMNKIWNAARFVLMNRADAQPDASIQPKGIANRWILHELNRLRDDVDQAFCDYRFNDAASALYHFIWGSYCDWYVEAAKGDLYGDNLAIKAETQTVMLTALDTWLRLLHPICPFITETLWQQLHGSEARLISEAWKIDLPVDDVAARQMGEIIEVVSSIRSIRGEMNIAPGKKLAAMLSCSADKQQDLQEHQSLLMRLARLESLDFVDADADIKGVAIAPLAFARVLLPLADCIDVPQETERLNKALLKLEKVLKQTSGKLDNPRFCKNAPDEIIDKVRAEQQAALEKQAELKASLLRLADL